MDFVHLGILKCLVKILLKYFYIGVVKSSNWITSQSKKFVLFKSNVRFKDTLTKIYNVVKLDRNKFMLKLTLRYPQNIGNYEYTYIGLLLENEKETDPIYYLKSVLPNYQLQFYIEINRRNSECWAGKCATWPEYVLARFC